MNYRHSYHVGNFADVSKHCLLILLLEALKKKETGFCYLDTHAGCGMYQLDAPETQKTLEYQEGIGKLLKLPTPPELLKTYLSLIKQFNPKNKLISYLGSPCIARTLLRPQDHAILTELHPEDYDELRYHFTKDRRTEVHLMDGYHALKAHLPPQQKRGLVLIDPPFESPKEFNQLLKSVEIIHQRWAHGIVAIWYPIKQRQVIQQFHQGLQKTGVKKILVTEFCVLPDDNLLGLNGSGLIVINPPWQFDIQAKNTLECLLPLLSEHPQRHCKVEWLVGE